MEAEGWVANLLKMAAMAFHSFLFNFLLAGMWKFWLKFQSHGLSGKPVPRMAEQQSTGAWVRLPVPDAHLWTFLGEK